MNRSLARYPFQVLSLILPSLHSERDVSIIGQQLKLVGKKY